MKTRYSLILFVFLFSCIIFVNSVYALTPPRLISPSNGAVVSTIPTLDWSSPSWAEWYHLYFKKETDSSWQYRANLKESSYTFKSYEALDSGVTYNWEVRACRGDPECVDSVDTWSFTTTTQYRKPCSISATVSTPSDVYVGDTVYTTVKLTNSGDVGGWVDVTAYLCREDSSCQLMSCDADDPWVAGGSTYTLTCSRTAPQEGYYYIKVDYSGCDADTTIYSGTFRVRAAPAPIYCDVDITKIILERDGVDPDTFYLGDNIRVSADVSVTGADPSVKLKMYVDNRYYDSETVDIPISGSKRVTFSRLIYTNDYGVTDPTVKVVATADCDPIGDTETKFFSIVYREGYLSSYRCSGNWRQQLYQYSSGTTEWRSMEYCSYGCSSGRCLDDPPDDPPATTCSAQYLSDYRCSGNWRQQLYQYSDCSTEWRNIEYCDYGCSNGNCLDNPPSSEPVYVSSVDTRYVTASHYVSNVQSGNAIYVDEIEVAKDISPRNDIEDIEKAQVWSQTQVTVAWGPIAILILMVLLGISLPFIFLRKSQFTWIRRIRFGRRSKPLEC